MQNSRKKCFYEVIGVSPTADDNEIKLAFRKKALALHPDKNQDDPEAKEKFQELNEAYEILKDPNERAWYDSHKDQILRGDDGGEQDFNGRTDSLGGM